MPSQSKSMLKFSMSPSEHNDLRGNLYAVDVKRIFIFLISYSLSPKSEYRGFDELIEQLIWHSLELSTKQNEYIIFFHYLSIESLKINRIEKIE